MLFVRHPKRLYPRWGGIGEGGVPCMLELFAFVARHGRYALACGLLAGFLLPDVAQMLRPFLAANDFVFAVSNSL